MLGPAAESIGAPEKLQTKQLIDLLRGLEAVALPADAIEVGYIGDAWGIKGGFKVHAHSAQPEALFSSNRWLIQPKATLPGAARRTLLLPIAQAKEHGDCIVATSAEIAERNTAEALKGSSIWVPRESFPAPDANEYYWVDLIGCQVSNREGLALGVVVELLSTGAQSVIAIDQVQADGTTVQRLIPFVAAFIDTVDTAGTTINVDWQPDY